MWGDASDLKEANLTHDSNHAARTLSRELRQVQRKYSINAQVSHA